jgi:hypothetical protein
MMRALTEKLTRLAMVFSMALVLMAPQISVAETVEENPSALAMVGDLVVARPLLLVMTVVGTVAYVITLPFSLAGGNAGQAGETLVLGPAEATFVRCLGCTRPGYKQDVVTTEEEVMED